MVEFQGMHQAVVADDSDGAFPSMSKPHQEHSAQQWGPNGKNSDLGIRMAELIPLPLHAYSLSHCFKVCEMARNPLPLCHLE